MKRCAVLITFGSYLLAGRRVGAQTPTKVPRVAVLSFGFRTLLLSALILRFLVAPFVAGAQQPGKVPRVGFLSLGSAPADISQRAGAVREELRTHGWVEGEAIAFEYRYADGKRERLTLLATDLVQKKVDVVVAFGTAATRAASQATRSIPIVMAGVGDPVRAGFVRNLARPEGNVTGVSLLVQELNPKRLELLKEVVPGVSRVAVVSSQGDAGADTGFKQLESAAPRLGIGVRRLVLDRRENLDSLFAEISRSRTDAVVVQPNPDIDEMRAAIARVALAHRLPTVFALRQYVEAGGLMSYGSNLQAMHRLAAAFVSKILNGARPADLPVEQPTKFELVINLTTAKALGLTIPTPVLLRADEVIR